MFNTHLHKIHAVYDQNPKKSLKLFEKLLKHNPDTNLLLLGKAKSLDRLSQVYKNNDFLREAISVYEQLILNKSLVLKNDKLFKEAAETCVERMKFLGNIVCLFVQRKTL